MGNYTQKSTVNNAQNDTQAVASFDSHFLPPLGNELNLLGVLSEAATFTPPGTQLAAFPPNTNNVGYGVGHAMTGGYAITDAARRPTLDFLYLVLPNDTTVAGGLPIGENSIKVSTNGGNFTLAIYFVPYTPPTPEPGSLAMIAACFNLLLRRRRV